MSYITRRWAIPAEDLRKMGIPKHEAQSFLGKIGVNTARPFDSSQDYSRDATLIRQKVWIEDPDGMTPLERKILKSIMPDEDMWVHEPLVSGRNGSYLLVMPEMDLAACMDPAKYASMPTPKELRIEEYPLTHDFEEVSLLVAIDEDSLEVYWARKTP